MDVYKVTIIDIHRVYNENHMDVTRVSNMGVPRVINLVFINVCDTMIQITTLIMIMINPWYEINKKIKNSKYIILVVI